MGERRSGPFVERYGELGEAIEVVERELQRYARDRRPRAKRSVRRLFVGRTARAINSNKQREAESHTSDFAIRLNDHIEGQ